MNATARISQHIPDISPSLAYRKERSVTTFPSTRRRNVQPRMEVIQEIEPAASWDKLPNLTQYKSAIVRQKVCQGLVYILPGDKNSRSLARPYTADLSQIFNKPYSSLQPEHYNEETVKQACAINFKPDLIDVKSATNIVNQQQPASINSESQKKYTDYQTLTIKKTNPRQRKDNLPTSVKGGPADVALREEVKEILNEVGVSQNVSLNVDEQEIQPLTEKLNTRPSLASTSTITQYKPTSTRPSSLPSQSASTLNVQEFRDHKYQKKSADYKNYRELRDAEVKKPYLPDELRSEYLSREKCDEIWRWLHWDFRKTQFQQFLEVCD